jgi:hypothetical protein
MLESSHVTLEPTRVTRSRLPVIAVAVWAAILAAIVAIGLVFGGRGATPDSTTSTLQGAGAPGGAPLNLNAPLAADPSATPAPSGSAGTNPGTNPGDDHDWKGPGGFAFGPGGPGRGGPGRGGPGRGAISITAISGSNLSLKTADGWTRTIDATGATITAQDGSALTLGDLKVGDQIVFRETRNADGTFKITAIVRLQPQADGSVKAVDATSITLTAPDGSTKTIGITSATKYTLKGQAATAADIKVGDRVHALGTTDTAGSFTATTVDIAPAVVGGTVTAKTASSITITDRGGTTVTIHVDSTTTYQTRGNASASLADVAVGNLVDAEGTLNADGSLNATAVQFGAPGQGEGRPFGGPGRGRGPNGGKPGIPGNPANPVNPGTTPAPSSTAG